MWLQCLYPKSQLYSNSFNQILDCIVYITLQNLWQQSAREIYEAYIAASFSKIRAVLDPSTVCAMEQYLTGENVS